MRVGLCRALAPPAIEPRWWCRSGEPGAWVMGLEWLIPWIEHFGPDHGLGVTDLKRLRELANPKPGPLRAGARRRPRPRLSSQSTAGEAHVKSDRPRPLAPPFRELRKGPQPACRSAAVSCSSAAGRAIASAIWRVCADSCENASAIARMLSPSSAIPSCLTARSNFAHSVARARATAGLLDLVGEPDVPRPRPGVPLHVGQIGQQQRAALMLGRVGQLAQPLGVGPQAADRRGPPLIRPAQLLVSGLRGDQRLAHRAPLIGSVDRARYSPASSGTSLQSAGNSARAGRGVAPRRLGCPIFGCSASICSKSPRRTIHLRPTRSAGSRCSLTHSLIVEAFKPSSCATCGNVSCSSGSAIARAV